MISDYMKIALVLGSMLFGFFVRYVIWEFVDGEVTDAANRSQWQREAEQRADRMIASVSVQGDNHFAHAYYFDLDEAKRKYDEQQAKL